MYKVLALLFVLVAVVSAQYGNGNFGGNGNYGGNYPNRGGNYPGGNFGGGLGGPGGI